MGGRIVLGVDPGTAVTGYGVVEETGSGLSALDFGVIRTPSTDPLSQRLLSLAQAFGHLLDRFSPDVVAVESIFFNRNAQSALSVGHARGVILLRAAQEGIPVFEYAPLEVKRAVTGYGRADKGQIQVMVASLLRLASHPRPVDAADALAVAICCTFSQGFRELVQSWEGDG